MHEVRQWKILMTPSHISMVGISLGTPETRHSFIKMEAMQVCISMEKQGVKGKLGFWDSCNLKLGFWDFTLFEIGILEKQP